MASNYWRNARYLGSRTLRLKTRQCGVRSHSLAFGRIWPVPCFPEGLRSCACKRQRLARTTVVPKQYSRVPWMDRKTTFLVRRTGFSTKDRLFRINPALVLPNLLTLGFITLLFSGCETPQSYRPGQSPAAAEPEKFSPPPATATTPAPSPEAPVPAPAPKPKPAVQPQAVPPKVVSAPKPLSAPAKAAPPHFPPPVVSSEAFSKPIPKTTPRSASPSILLGNDTQRPHLQSLQTQKRANEVRPAGLVWFAGALAMVSLVSFGYPLVRGRVEEAVAGLELARFRPSQQARQKPERIQIAKIVLPPASASEQPEIPPPAENSTPTSDPPLQFAPAQAEPESAPSAQTAETGLTFAPAFSPLEDPGNQTSVAASLSETLSETFSNPIDDSVTEEPPVPAAVEMVQAPVAPEPLSVPQTDICTPEESSTAVPLTS